MLRAFSWDFMQIWSLILVEVEFQRGMEVATPEYCEGISRQASLPHSKGHQSCGHGHSVSRLGHNTPQGNRPVPGWISLILQTRLPIWFQPSIWWEQPVRIPYSSIYSEGSFMLGSNLRWPLGKLVCLQILGDFHRGKLEVDSLPCSSSDGRWNTLFLKQIIWFSILSDIWHVNREVLLDFRGCIGWGFEGYISAYIHLVANMAGKSDV